jgi:hypothetical protein
MSFDFVSIYSSYSNVDLLRIIAEPHKYQKEAIDAVQKILSQRDVTELDKAEIALELQPKTAQAINTTGRAGNDLSIFSEDMSPEVLAKINTWKYTVLLFVGFEFLYRFYYSLKYMWYIFTSPYASFSWLLLFNLLITFLSPVGLLLFMRRSKTGWMILAGKAVMSSFLSVLAIGLSLYLGGYNNVAMSIFFLIIIGVSIYFLWKKPLLDWYGIDKTTVIKTVVISGVISVCCGILINYNLFRTLLL